MTQTPVENHQLMLVKNSQMSKIIIIIIIMEVGGRVETIQTTALLKTARILRRVLET